MGDDDPRLRRAAQEYLAELEAGRKPERAAFVARFPDLAGQLEPYLDALDMVHTGAPRLRSPSGRPTAADPIPAEPLGDFRIVREIGRGGMGVVYEAVQMSLGRRVALKVLPFAAALDAKQLQRFRNEAQAAAQLHHTNIVPVYAVGCERGVHYYAMQLIEGPNFADLIRQMRPQRPPADRGTGNRPGPSPTVAPSQGDAALDPGANGPPDPDPGATQAVSTMTGAAAAIPTERATRSARFYRTAARLIVQAAEALEHAHQLGVIHRDVKPANLMVDAAGNVWVTDFGLAQFHTGVGLTRTGDLLGTLRYMSPEQAAGQGTPLDARTDVYSLGATLYELLTLEPLFAADDYQRLLRQILNDEPRPPRALERSVPPELETIVLKAVSKNPADRYGTAREFADDLHRFLDHRPILARRPTVVQRVRKLARRHPSVVIAGVMFLLLLTAGSLVSMWLIGAAYERERQRADEAEKRFKVAKQSVDEMIQVSEQELAGNPFTEELRTRLLLSALDYYQEFIDEHRDDPRAKADLENMQDHVNNMLADVAMLQSARQLPLLRQEAVQDDLALSDPQRQEVSGLSSNLDKQGKQWDKDFVRHSPAERNDLFVKWARTNDAEVQKILSAGQYKRLRQIALQVQGPGAFRDLEVIKALELTHAQRESIRKIEGETFSCPPGPGGPPENWQKQHEEQVKAATDRILVLLTAEQARRWQELTGEPCKGPVHLPGPFGPPPDDRGPHGHPPPGPPAGKPSP